MFNKNLIILLLLGLISLQGAKAQNCGGELWVEFRYHGETIYFKDWKNEYQQSLISEDGEFTLHIPFLMDDNGPAARRVHPDGLVMIEMACYDRLALEITRKSGPKMVINISKFFSDSRFFLAVDFLEGNFDLEVYPDQHRDKRYPINTSYGCRDLTPKRWE